VGDGIGDGWLIEWFADCVFSWIVMDQMSMSVLWVDEWDRN
jgi:hypothetical protein